MKIKKILKKYRQSVEMLGIKRSFLEGIKLFINPFSKKIFFNYIDYEKAFEVLNSIKNEEIHKFKVSFIIPTYNGMDKGLPDLIDSIKNQSFRNIEIIAVDSGSSDGTVEYLLKRGVKVIKIKKTEFRHDYARNVGAEEASGDFLVFTVQDAQFEDRKWVEIGIKSLIGFNCDSFTTPQIPKPNHDIYAAYLSQNFIKNNNYKSGLIIVNRLKILSSFLFSTLSYKSREAALHIDNTNHMVRKETYLKIKYNLQTCEDMDFAKRLIKSGKRWIYSTLTYVLHSHFYNDYFQYFSRVFVDAIEINKMLFNLGFKKKVKPYIYDCLVFLFILFVYSIDCVQRKLIFNLFKNTKLTDLLVIITNKGNTLLVDINKKLYINSFQFITEISNFIRTYLNNQFDFFILLEKKDSIYQSDLVLELINKLKLACPNFVYYHQLIFRDIREHIIGHLFSFNHDLIKITMHEELKYQEFKRLILLALINVFAVNLSKLYIVYEDSDSINSSILDSLTWI